MKWLDNPDLGVVSLVQTIIMFIGLFQFGLVNGGYRIFALDKAEQQRDINNVLFTYFGLLAVAVLIAWSILALSGSKIIIDNSLMLAALLCGILSLINNWLTNTLIGKRLIKDINIINIVSGTISPATLPLVLIMGTKGAVIALFIQPLIFVTMTLFKHKELRPSKWNFDLKLVKYILSFGFLPFLAGIFVLGNMQIERWSIAEILGTAPLGQFYLVFLYATLFVLVPTSLLNIFFPKAIKAYEQNEMVLFITLLKKHFAILIGYLVLVILVTIFVMQPFVDLLLPLHSSNTSYVYYFLPGLVFLVLSDPIAIVLNSAVKLKPMLYVGLLSVTMNISLIWLSDHFGIFTLTNMAIIKSIINSISFLTYLMYMMLSYKTIFKKANL